MYVALGIVLVIGMMIIARKMQPMMEQHAAEARVRAELQAEFNRFASLPPGEMQREIAERDAKREATLDREWAMEPDEHAAAVQAALPHWQREDVANIVGGCMVEKLRRRGDRHALPMHQPTEDELAHIDAWVSRFR